MEGLVAEAGKAKQPAGKAPAGGDKDLEIGAMLVLQPMRQFLKPDKAQELVEAAKAGEPAMSIASAAISAVTASGQAADSKGVPLTAEIVGQATEEVIKGLAGLLVVAGVVPADGADQVVEKAKSYMMRQQAQEQPAEGGV